MSTGLRFTIAVCTYNRCDVLPTAIRSAAQQKYNMGAFEVVVVDNNSTDDTKATATELSTQFDSVKYFNEPSQGLCHGRNKAISKARGEYIVFLDDDAEMVPGYLRALDETINEEDNLGAVGGPIEIAWLGPVPDWYEPGLDYQFNKLNISSTPMELCHPQILYGTNMAFPTELLKDLGGFSTNFKCPEGGVTAEADDEYIQLRIQTQTDKRIMWDPKLKVTHYIHPSRLTPEYIVKKAKWTGRGTCRVDQAFPGYGGLMRPISGLGEWFLRKLFFCGKGPVTDRAHLAWSVGYLNEWWAEQRR